MNTRFKITYAFLTAMMLTAYGLGWFLEPATRLTRVPDTLYCLSWIFITLKSIRDKTSGYPPLLIPYPLTWELLAIYYIDVTGMLPFMRFNYWVWLICSFICLGVIAKYNRAEFTFGRPRLFVPKFAIEFILTSVVCVLYATTPRGLEGFFIDIGCALATLISIMFFALLVNRPSLAGQSLTGNVLRIFAELGSLSYTLSLHRDSLFLMILFVFTLLLDVAYVIVFIRRLRMKNPISFSRIATAIVVAIGATSISGCAHVSGISGDEKPKVGIFEIDYRQYGTSIPGRWLLMANQNPRQPPDDTSVSTMVALETTGKVFPLKVLKGRGQNRVVMEIRKVAPDLYAYVDCEYAKEKCASTEIRFMESDGADVTWLPTPSGRSDLNFHDFYSAPGGNFVYLFSNLESGAHTIDNEIAEWDTRGRTVFRWKLDDHAREIAKPDRTAHVNSIDVDEKGDIYVGIPRTNTILKLDKRTGRILADISKPAWKFIGDPYDGFVFQHSVRALPGGNLLMFDNGDGVSGRTSRAVEYRIDFSTKTATLVWEYRIPNDDVTFRPMGGSVQRLSNGNTLVSWGVPGDLRVQPTTRIASEVDREGRVVRELRGQIVAFRVWFDEFKERSSR